VTDRRIIEALLYLLREYSSLRLDMYPEWYSTDEHQKQEAALKALLAEMKAADD
jgi:hypothetical protein